MANDIVHIIVEVVLFLGVVMWAGSLISLIYYDRKVWNEKQVRNAVLKGWITEEEFKMITGKDY